ncbi:MAG TPA: GNAT family N-acetyltransferase [candidate division Zixibacteria bacterium]|nr:GNAT family N-acetyltransferase [candidate division Zixibacteria bacterium]MDD4917659.1 GNAT family N-acetyltransferase [candidate division Zixibacteria bacterium]MDM7974063.1 GNAT family N-acetyltransferase [candidate division Zixibacteria bacterium]HOD65523.1 GNAT family N-acetyltransferase [candidate division Zixibacteria bacterium]HPM36961.1 GNAT family N-acetyltransferase [candidate division Zixibacteria bacterium]
MISLTNEDGITCASLMVLQEDREAWAIVVSWKKGVDGLPDRRAFHEALESSIGECVRMGALYLDSRVITASTGVDDALTSSRAALHRDFLSARGFVRGEDRVEYQMDLAVALSMLEADEIEPSLVWECVNTECASALARAADLFSQASEGDPASNPGEDAVGFVKALIEEKETVQAPERLQIGMCGNDPAAVLALKVYPSDGWSTIYYLGVLPVFRGRGFGAAAMLQALHSLKAMGGRIYHDGTASGNAGALALFARLGQPPFRVMETWRLRR